MAALRGPLVAFGFSELVAGLAMSTWSVLVATGVITAEAGPSMPAFLPVVLVVAALPAGLLLCGLGVRLLMRALLSESRRRVRGKRSGRGRGSLK